MGLAIGRRTLDDSIVVYDMTGFLSRHPGGYERVARNCGTVNCAWEMRYKGHRFFALDDSSLGFAVRARGGVALGTLTEYSNGSCLE